MISKDEKPFAYLLSYHGPGKYARPFDGSGYGVMFEDDGQTGYFYATTENFDRILDALHLYNKGDSNQPRETIRFTSCGIPDYKRQAYSTTTTSKRWSTSGTNSHVVGQVFLQALRRGLEDGPRLMHGTMR